MQILSNALPGFRDIRAPAVAGYLWLLVAWMAWQPDLSKRPKDDFAASVYELGEQIGRVGIVIGLSVAAYLVGSVSQVLANALRAAWTFLLSELWLYLPVGIDRVVGTAPAYRAPEEEEIVQLANRAINASAAASPHRSEAVDIDIEGVADRAIVEARAELSFPATVLVGKEPEIFAEVDRLRSEGEFRVAAVPPLIALVLVTVASTGSRWYFAALVPVLALLDQGVRRLRNSRELVADAKARGLVPSLALERFRNWTEAIEAKPDAPPQAPWRPRERQRRRPLTDEEALRIEKLSAPTDQVTHDDIQLFETLSDDAAEALNYAADDELRYAGTDTAVGLTAIHPGIDELLEHGLVHQASDDSLLTLTHRGIALARLSQQRRRKSGSPRQ